MIIMSRGTFRVDVVMIVSRGTFVRVDVVYDHDVTRDVSCGGRGVVRELDVTSQRSS